MLYELEHLDISDSQINLIPPGFISQMSKLKYLSLRGNRLKLIDDQMFGNGQNIRGKSKQTLEVMLMLSGGKVMLSVGPSILETGLRRGNRD
uniref:Uncharacterized protein n=1 Tax=Meloidogyne incognita TaxID=6306 RepID=A0A914N526_MELIC